MPLSVNGKHVFDWNVLTFLGLFDLHTWNLGEESDV